MVCQTDFWNVSLAWPTKLLNSQSTILIKVKTWHTSQSYYNNKEGACNLTIFFRKPFQANRKKFFDCLPCSLVGNPCFQPWIGSYSVRSAASFHWGVSSGGRLTRCDPWWGSSLDVWEFHVLNSFLRLRIFRNFWNTLFKKYLNIWNQISNIENFQKYSSQPHGSRFRGRVTTHLSY